MHRQAEQQLIDHFDRLLDDERLRVDTINGRRPIPTLGRRIQKEDKEVELKRLMVEMDVPDRELQNQMPIGQSVSVTLWRSQWMMFKRNVGRLKVICLSPTKQLLKGETPTPLAALDIRKTLSQLSQGDREPDLPTTLVMMSTSGFTLEAHELAERNANRTLILVEPNEGGGWTVTGPAETKALVDLFDPEEDESKLERVRDQIEQNKAELIGGSLSAERLAGATHLPLHLVEAELKSYAKENAGLVAKRLDGRLVLFREGGSPMATGVGSLRSGGSDMPFLQRVKSLFARKGETEKKIALLSERRAALSQQRDTADVELTTLEQKESSLREQFKATESAASKRRLTSQLLQLRKDLERRQQLLGMLNQQINIVSTHLHNLELVNQGKAAKLPDSEELAADAAAAEEVLAELQADNEVAGATGISALGGMTDEEQALYEELERESAPPDPAPEPAAEKSKPLRQPPERTKPAQTTVTEQVEEPTVANEPRRNDPEPG